MGSCQVVLMLKQAAELWSYLSRTPSPLTGEGRGEGEELASEWRQKADTLTQNLLTYALNEEGYLNGCFTDNGEWVFSPKDPDGKRWRHLGRSGEYAAYRGIDLQGTQILDRLIDGVCAISR
jgi:hypothetical protein